MASLRSILIRGTPEFPRCFQSSRNCQATPAGDHKRALPAENARIMSARVTVASRHLCQFLSLLALTSQSAAQFFDPHAVLSTSTHRWHAQREDLRSDRVGRSITSSKNFREHH